MTHMGAQRAPLWLTMLVALLLCGGLLAASAEETAPPAAPAAAPANGPGGTVYNIEIIVFRATSALGAPEDWSAEAGARNVAGEESPSGAAQVGHFVAPLPSSAWQLGELESRLRSSGVYVPVAHTAWSQTASSWGTRFASRWRVSASQPAGAYPSRTRRAARYWLRSRASYGDS